MNFSLLERVYADGPVTTLVNPWQLGSGTTLGGIIALITNILIGIGIALVIIFLVLGGIRYLTSGGDQKAAQEARAMLTNAVIGFVIVLGAITLRFVLGNLLGENTDYTNPIGDLSIEGD